MTAKVTYLNPPDSPPSGMYSHVSLSPPGTIIHLAGQTSMDANGKPVAPDDIKAQARQVFANLDTALKAAGANFSDVLAYTTYLVGREPYAGWTEARKEIFAEIYPDGKYPPNTLLIISGLARQEFLLEIAATARVPD